MLRIKNLSPQSELYRSGLRHKDEIVSINNESIDDQLDFHFAAATSILEIEYLRNGKPQVTTVIREPGYTLEVDFYEQEIHLCRNRCIFCFIDQMPKGLRKSLYIKDEDFKYSFLNGNYVTLSGATQEDLDKVIRIGLSPLYISVHATDTKIRNSMLRNSKAPSILDQLTYLSKNRIAFHTQIVVCKGYNDNKVLLQTIQDLLKFKSNLLSVAVVPVGLTKFRKFHLEPIQESDAISIYEKITPLSEKQTLKDGMRKIFLADEIFLKAKKEIPTKSYYENYPQIENGVGLIRQLLDEWTKVKRGLQKEVTSGIKIRNQKPLLLITSQSAFPYLDSIAKYLNKKFITQITCLPIKNNFFGETVTVAGLISASDIIDQVIGSTIYESIHGIILPHVLFNYRGFTLDGYSKERLENRLRRKVYVIEYLQEINSILFE